MENVHDCHPTSCSASGKRLLGEFTFCQKSDTKNSETIVRCDKKVGQRAERNSRYIRQENSWKRTTLLTDRAFWLSTAKNHVFSDSALCMGRISENPVSAWKEKINRFMNSPQCRELGRIDGEPKEFEDFPRIHNIADSRRDPQQDD